MRNDYPDNPAGPLRHYPDPVEVLEIRQPGQNTWGLVLIGAILLALSVFGGVVVPAVSGPAPRASRSSKPDLPIFPALGFFGVMLLGGGMYMVEKNKQPTIIIRRDGLEFPLLGWPPLRWDEVQKIDIGKFDQGRNGVTYYLGLKLRPGVLQGLSSPYSTMLMRSLRKVVGWDFDICLSEKSLSMAPAHIAMQMRARLENVQSKGALPPPPDGYRPLPSTPMAERAQVAWEKGPKARMRMGCAGGMFGCGGFLAFPGVMYLLGQWMPTAQNFQHQRDAWMKLLGGGAVMMAVAVIFVWPWPDDEDDA